MFYAFYELILRVMRLCIVKRQRLYEYPTVVIDSNDIHRASTRQTRSPYGATFSTSNRHVKVLSDVLNYDYIE
jgi:hypothetical protein